MLLNSSLHHDGGSSSKKDPKWITDAETWYFSHFGSQIKEKLIPGRPPNDHLRVSVEAGSWIFSSPICCPPTILPSAKVWVWLGEEGGGRGPSPHHLLSVYERGILIVCLIRYSLLVVRAARWRDRLWMAESVIYLPQRFPLGNKLDSLDFVDAVQRVWLLTKWDTGSIWWNEIGR